MLKTHRASLKRMGNATRAFLTAAVVAAFLVGPVATESAQLVTAGPVVLKNESTAELTLTNFRYVDSLGQTRSVTGGWKLKPGFYGYLTYGPGQNKIYARKITYDLVTAEGKTVGWFCQSRGLDKDGDFSSRFTEENLRAHLKILGKAPVVAFRPALVPVRRGPTDEQIARGAVKALGAALFHQKAKMVPENFGDALAIELARTARDELIKSAVDDLFLQLPARDRSTLGRLVPLALDGQLTDSNLRAAEAKDEIIAYLRKKNPDFALAAQAADFLYRVQQRSR